MEHGKDDLHSKLFEAHAQMCDISRQISTKEASYHKQICEGQIEARKKLIDMEKKKMTKTEAFEYLKCKKVYVAGKGGEIQEVLFKAGFSWGSSASQKIESTDKPFLYTDNEGSLTYGTNMDLFIRDTNEEISAEDILSIEIVEGTPEFSFKKVVELAKPLMEYLNDTGCTEQIGVSYDRIVAQPMATFLYGEMKEERR